MNRRRASSANRLERETLRQLSDPKWRKYAAAIEKTLASFELVLEWADFVTFLARLLKTLQSFPQFTVIPHKLLVAKRLAQCLNPALPTGVHQRALDVYVHVLSTIGPEYLAKDLAAWSSGLFPFFQYAATSVRPIVLGIFTKFYFPLQEALRPCTKAFVLALLPGVEEETGEFFDRVSALLDQLSGIVSPPFFFQHLWLILLTAPSSRTSALNYLSKRMPTIKADDRLAPIVGDDVGLMTRGLAAALDDNLLYVQRAALDLLISSVHLEGAGFQNELRHADRLALMQSALSIVLKRDLSLSRRLYVWLLGNADTPSEAQISHLSENGLGILCESIRADLEKTSGKDTTDRQRPFKIFLALLDKWEIGSLVTEKLVVNVLTSMQACLELDGQTELRAVANMLYESLDPSIMWRQLYLGLKQDFTKSCVKHIRLVEFLTVNFSTSDANVSRLHLPLLAFGLLDLIHSHDEANTEQCASTTKAGLLLLQNLLNEVQPDFFVLSTEETPNPTDYVERYYDHPSAQIPIIPPNTGAALCQRGFEKLLELIRRHATTGDLLSYEIMPNLFEALSLLSHAENSGKLTVAENTWTGMILPFIGRAPLTKDGFDCLAAFVTTTMSLSDIGVLNHDQSSRAYLTPVITKLLSYLSGDFTTIHVEAARLFWLVQETYQSGDVQAVLSSRMLSPDSAVQENAFDAFGTIWRFAEDEELPSRTLSTPLYIVLEGTQSQNTTTKRLAEAWMRCSFKSYLRLLDPMLLALSDPSIKRESVSYTIAKRTVNTRQYPKTFDVQRVLYILRHIYDLFLSRGTGFHKTAKASLVRSSPDPEIPKRMADFGAEDLAYLDALCLILVEQVLNSFQLNLILYSFLASEPSESLRPSMLQLNTYVHSAALDTLQIIVQRADLEPSIFRLVQHTILVRLLRSVETGALDLQNKYLHTLHATMQARVIVEKRQTLQRRSIDRSRSAVDSVPESELHSAQVVDDLFAQTILYGLANTENNASLHFWVDFLFMTVGSLQSALDTIIYPLLDILLGRLKDITASLRTAFDPNNKGKGPAVNVSESGFVALAGAVERLVLFSLDETKLRLAAAENAADEKSPQSSEPSGGFFTYVTGAFSASDAETSKGSRIEQTSTAITKMADSVEVLLQAGATATQHLKPESPDSASSQAFITMRISTRSKRCLERFLKSYPAETIEAFALVFDQIDSPVYALDTLEQLLPNAHSIVLACCDRIDLATPPAQRKGKPFRNQDLSDVRCLQFLSKYLERLEGTMALQVWPVMNNFVKLVAAPLQNNKAIIYPAFKCYTTLCEKIAKTSALEDRRIRKELQENFVKLLDLAVPLAVKEARAAKKPTVLEKSPIIGEEDEKGLTASVTDLSTSALTAVSTGSDLLPFLSSRVVPSLKNFMLDAEKAASLCASILQHCISPQLSKRNEPFDAPEIVFNLLHTITHQSGAVKIWRPPVSDWFFDTKFFASPPVYWKYWQQPIQDYITSDKERMPDLLGRVAAPSSANIFANREAENINRALSIRRISFVLFTAEKNKFLLNMPAIQEKLVDVLKLSPSVLIQSEVYLCLRVILCKISEQHLSSLWPILLADLLGLFENVLSHEPIMPAEQVPLILAACKFLDLLLVLQTEEFQIHEWMFVTDTTDAILPPDAWTPVAVIDRLSLLLTERGSVMDSTELSASAKRRPLLKDIRQNSKIGTIGQLETFLAHMSLYNYEASYQRTQIDYQAIADGIAADMFEG